ncbi:MAG: hypothetical protein AAGJ93_16705 [Bacteroidota bacterium]
MSLNKEIKELDAERLAEGEKSRAHYNALDLPGQRVVTTGSAETDAVRKRIAAMRKEREEAQQENPIK